MAENTPVTNASYDDFFNTPTLTGNAHSQDQGLNSLCLSDLHRILGAVFLGAVIRAMHKLIIFKQPTPLVRTEPPPLSNFDPTSFAQTEFAELPQESQAHAISTFPNDSSQSSTFPSPISPNCDGSWIATTITNGIKPILAPSPTLIPLQSNIQVHITHILSLWLLS